MDFYTKSEIQNKSIDWNELLQTLLTQGIPLATAIVQANAQLGTNFNANQVPSYIIHQYGGNTPGNSGNNSSNKSSSFDYTPVIIGAGVVVALAVAYFMFKS